MYTFLGQRSFQQSFKSDVVTTTDATVTTIFTYQMQDKSAVSMWLEVQAFGPIAIVASSYLRKAAFRRNGGTVSQAFTTRTIVTDDETTSTTNLTLSISGTTVLVRATGVVATTYNWQTTGRVWMRTW